MTGEGSARPAPSPPLVREFTNEGTELRPMSTWLREACAALGASGAVVDEAELCANEVFANLCAHAFPSGGRHRIRLAVTAAPRGVSLTVEDDGIAFDPVAAPPAALPGVLADARAGGYGLTIIRHLARAMAYERAGERNRLTLTFGPP